FAVNSSDRETGLLNSKVIDPGSNICGITFDVIKSAAISPNTPTIQSIAVVSTHSLMNESICFFENGSGSLANPRYAMLIESLDRQLKCAGNAASIASRFNRASSAFESLSAPRAGKSLASFGNETSLQASES